MFIEFTAGHSSFDKIVINITSIASFHKDGNYTKIHMIDGSKKWVLDDYETVKKLIGVE